jgi:hypothetical protein
MKQTELPPLGFEPGTFSFKVQCSTTDLKRHVPLAELLGAWFRYTKDKGCGIVHSDLSSVLFTPPHRGDGARSTTD